MWRRCLLLSWQVALALLSHHEPDEILVYPHIMKTGGTALSIILAFTTRVECGSRLSYEFMDDDDCDSHDTPWFGSHHDQFLEFSKELGTPEPGKVRTAFGHFYSATGIPVRPALDKFRSRRVRLLLLVRSPLPHRASFFSERKGTSVRAANFSAWIRSKDYARAELGMQVKAYSTLGAPDADAVATHPLVAWIGVTEHWLESLCALSRIVPIDNPKLWAINTRFKWTDPLDDLASDDDYRFLATAESTETRFVQRLARRLLETKPVVPTCLVPTR